jgi:hypothetical protein
VLIKLPFRSAYPASRTKVGAFSLNEQVVGLVPGLMDTAAPGLTRWCYEAATSACRPPSKNTFLMGLKACGLHDWGRTLLSLTQSRPIDPSWRVGF